MQLQAAGESLAAQDVEQLRGLCKRIDEEASLPVRSEELTNGTPIWVRQFFQLVDEVVTRCTGEPWFKRQQASQGRYYYGYSVKLDLTDCYIHLDLQKCTNLGSTPFWLSIPGNQRKPADWERQALAEYER